MSSLCINQCSSKVCTTLFLVVCFLILLGHSDAFRSGTHVRKGRKKTKRTQQVSDTQHHRKLRKVPKYCSPDKLNYDLIFSGTSEYYEKESTKKWTNVCIRWYLSTTPTEAPIMTPDLNGTSSPSLSPSSNPTTSGKQIDGKTQNVSIVSYYVSYYEYTTFTDLYIITIAT